MPRACVPPMLVDKSKKNACVCNGFEESSHSWLGISFGNRSLRAMLRPNTSVVAK